MTELEKAARQALEALEAEMEFPNTGPGLTFMKNAITALRQALEQQPVTAPVAWMWKFDDEGAAFSTREPTASIKDGVNYVPLYTAPQEREWVGLTDEDIDELVRKNFGYIVAWQGPFAHAIEKILKEKNT